MQFAKHHAATLVIYTAIVIAKDGDIEYTMYIHFVHFLYAIHVVWETAAASVFCCLC